MYAELARLCRWASVMTRSSLMGYFAMIALMSDEVMFSASVLTGGRVSVILSLEPRWGYHNKDL